MLIEKKVIEFNHSQCTFLGIENIENSHKLF